MEEWGNGRANAYYEANIPREYIRPKENDPVRVIERFIRDKYEHKRFVAKSLPPPKGDKTDDESNSEPVKSKPSKNSKNVNTIPVKQPAVAAAAPTPAPAVESNLLDFMDASPPNPPTVPLSLPQTVSQTHPPQPPAAQIQQQTAFSQSFSDFGPPPSFGGASMFGAPVRHQFLDFLLC